jgi:hypothetical protein
MGDFAHTTHHTNPGKKSGPPLFLEDKIPWGIQFPTVPRRPIFEKSSHLREKGGVLMLFKTTRHLEAKAQTTVD